jgi:hypothetical protein
LQPFVHRGADHAGAAAPALSGDDENRTIPARLRPHQEGREGVLGLEAAEAVQVDLRLDRIAFARQPALAARLKLFRQAAGAGGR